MEITYSLDTEDIPPGIFQRFISLWLTVYNVSIMLLMIVLCFSHFSSISFPLHSHLKWDLSGTLVGLKWDLSGTCSEENHSFFRTTSIIHPFFHLSFYHHSREILRYFFGISCIILRDIHTIYTLHTHYIHTILVCI